MSAEPTILAEATEAEVVDFLGDASAYGPGTTTVERHETHGAFVFLAGEHAYKVKRRVRYDYMDFSTLELRRRGCQREIEINRPHAPEIYRGVVPITRQANGTLAIGGDGTPVEWAVHMRRFAAGDLLAAVAERDAIDATLARALADAVYEYHATAAVVHGFSSCASLSGVISEIVEALRSASLGFDAEAAGRLDARCRSRLGGVAPMLERRAGAGHVRRCHGDLHLGNIVLWRGRPTLFDALEFDESLATIDTYYDLAFLLMDLDQRRRRRAANIVLNRYVWRRQEALDLDGLAALPLFLGLRAAIRAMVIAQRAVIGSQRPVRAAPAAAIAYLQAAVEYLSPVPARLVAVGGLSGTGKSTLAAALAPTIGPAPGALHLRSDLERKALFGAKETEPLDPSRYTIEAGRRVYATLCGKARAALAAGHAVIIDAVYLDAEERVQIEAVARELAVPFTGLWLTASQDTITQRVATRTGDASDATPEVVRRQAAQLAGMAAVGWIAVDASGTREATMRAAFDALDSRGALLAVVRRD